MDEKNIYNPQHFEQIIGRIKKMEKLFSRIDDKDIVRRISKHDVLVRGELNDLDIIWKRFLSDRQELIALAPISRQYREGHEDINSEEARRILAREIALENSLKVDLKSLFLFGDILFNKLVLLIRSVYGSTKSIEYRSFTSFLKSIRGLVDPSFNEYRLHQKLGENLERIDVLLGFYRDKFIVHVSGPYQEGIIRSVYLPEIRLDHTSWKLNEFDFDKFNRLLSQLKDILPEKDKFGNPLNIQSDPRLKVEALFMHLHKIKDPNLKEQVEGYIRSVGLSSPDIYYLIKTVKDTALELIDILENHVNQNYVNR